MAKHSATAAYLVEHYEAATRRSALALRDYLGKPSEAHAHVLRSTLRRVDALLRLVPKTSRDREMRAYEKGCRRMLKLTSPIRDLDLLSERLRPAASDPAVASLMRKAARRRRKLVEDSMRASWKLFEQPAPKIGRGDLSGADARINEVLADLDARIVRLLPKVVGNEGRIEELHSLRKRCKRLRYVVEAAPPSDARKKTAELLKSWQDTLGAVRDSDVLIGYLRDEPTSASMRRILRAERISRHAQYSKFRRSCEAIFGSGDEQKFGSVLAVHHARGPRVADLRPTIPRKTTKQR